MNEQLTERLDSHDEMIDHLVTKVEALETRRYPDYERQTAELMRIADEAKAYLADVKTFMQSLPKVMPVKHSLDWKSKAVVLTGCFFLLLAVLLTAWNISLHAENQTLKGQALKYRAIRQTFPVQSDWADSTFRADPENFEQTTIRLEEQALASAHAKDIADQKTREADAAEANAKQLTEKSKQARKQVLSGNKK